MQLKHDVALISEQQLSAADLYRLFGYDELDRLFWGYCVESARVDNLQEIEGCSIKMLAAK